MVDCPPDTELAEYLVEALAPEHRVRLTAHLEACAACRDRLDRLKREILARARLDRLLPSDASLNEPPTSDGAPSFSEARTLVLTSNTPLVIPHPTGLPSVPGFDIVGEIGRGGMGVVYKARHRRLNRLVALKMVLTGALSDSRTVQRFLFEAEILARVQHPQVVQVYEVDTFVGPNGVPIPYLAIELLEGGSLSRRIKDGPLASQAAAELMEGIARAVHAVHLQGVIHRDLKPGNILFPGKHENRNSKSESETGLERLAVSKEPELTSDFGFRVSDLSPKVTDFGLAKFTQDGADLTGSGQVVGTPHYMAPEQAAGSKQTGPAVDVHALGAILFECLTGRPPFQGSEPMSVLVQVVTDPAPDLRSLRSEVPRDLSAVVMRCLNKDPRRRYASAEDLANDLRRFLEGRPTRARPVTLRERAWLWARRNPAVTALLATLAAVLVVAFGAVTYLWIEARDIAQRERHAKEQSELAEGRALDANSHATRTLAHLEFGRAVTWCQEGRIREGLDLFVRAVELAEATGENDLARVARMNLAAWPRELPRQRVAFPHAQQPRLAAFHPDGTHMVTAGRGSAIYLWNTSTKEKVRTYRPSIIKPLYRFTGVTYWTVAVSPDGRFVAAGSSEGSITVWNTDSAEPRMSFDALGLDGDVWSVAFAPDGTLWANDGRSGLKQWDVQGSKPKLVRQGQLPAGTRGGILQVIAIAPDGRHLYTGDRAGVVREWDTLTANELRNWDAGGWVQDLAVSPDGKRIAATGPAGIARIIDLAANRVERDIDLASAYGNGIAFAPTAPFLLTSDGDGTVRTWHRETGMPIGEPFRFSGEVTKIRFRPGSEEFAVPAGNSVFLCKIPDPPGDLVTAGDGQRLRGLDISPAGDRVAISDDDGFELFDPFTPKRLQRVDYAFFWPYYLRQDAPLTLRFDPDPKRARVFRGTRNGFDYLAVPEGHWAQSVRAVGLGRVSLIEFLDGGRSMLVADNNLVARWDTSFLRRPTVVPIENMPAGVELRALAARPDGQEVLIAFTNRVVFLDPATLKPRRPGWTTGDEILDAKYTPDGTRVLIGRRDNEAELRNAKDGSPAARPMPHGKAVLAVAVSPDGKVLLTGSRDGTARFWDARTGLPIGPPLRHLGPVTHLVYASNGDHALTGTGTGHVVLWDTPPAPARGTPADLRAAIQRRD